MAMPKVLMATSADGAFVATGAVVLAVAVMEVRVVKQAQVVLRLEAGVLRVTVMTQYFRLWQQS